jgi:hypothetical protein
MEQPDLFAGAQLRDLGIAAAERDRVLVVQAVDVAISTLVARGRAFTAEDVRATLGRYVRDLDDVSKVIGGRIRKAATAGLIHTTGATVTAVRRDAHARRMLVWHPTSTLEEVQA